MENTYVRRAGTPSSNTLFLNARTAQRRALFGEIETQIMERLRKSLAIAHHGTRRQVVVLGVQSESALVPCVFSFGVVVLRIAKISEVKMERLPIIME